MELELSQALIELRRLTLFQGPALEEAIPATGARGRPAMHAGPSGREPRCRYEGLEPEGTGLAR